MKINFIFQKVFVFCPFLGVNALYYNENKFIGLKLEIKEQNNNLLITIGKQVDFLFLYYYYEKWLKYEFFYI